MIKSTFGNSKTDLVLAEHLTLYPEQANWACRAIGKITTLLHNFETSAIENKKFARAVFNLIWRSTIEHVNNPPEHINEKTKTYTANIITRHLRESFKKNFND